MNINIPGIDMEKAIQNSGSKELLAEILGDVYKLMDEKTALVETYLKEQDMHNYTIQVHALKSTCRMIGAMELGEAFFTLEKLGNENHLEQIEALTPGTLQAFQSLKPYLAPYASMDGESKTDFNKDAILAILSKLITAMEDFDLGTAETAMKELFSYNCSSELTKKFESLDHLITNLDYDDVKVLASDIRKQVEEGSSC